MKAYTVEVTVTSNPKLIQGEDNLFYFPPTTNVIHHMLRYNDPKKKSGWIKALTKELNTIIGSGTLNNKEDTKPNEVVVLTTGAYNIKLDQYEMLTSSR
jgi:hypothetical protein